MYHTTWGEMFIHYRSYNHFCYLKNKSVTYCLQCWWRENWSCTNCAPFVVFFLGHKNTIWLLEWISRGTTGSSLPLNRSWGSIDLSFFKHNFPFKPTVLVQAKVVQFVVVRWCSRGSGNADLHILGGTLICRHTDFFYYKLHLYAIRNMADYRRLLLQGVAGTR